MFPNFNSGLAIANRITVSCYQDSSKIRDFSSALKYSCNTDAGEVSNVYTVNNDCLLMFHVVNPGVKSTTGSAVIQFKCTGSNSFVNVFTIESPQSFCCNRNAFIPNSVVSSEIPDVSQMIRWFTYPLTVPVKAGTEFRLMATETDKSRAINSAGKVVGDKTGLIDGWVNHEDIDGTRGVWSTESGADSKNAVVNLFNTGYLQCGNDITKQTNYLGTGTDASVPHQNQVLLPITCYAYSLY